MSGPRFSVVIPARDRANLLRRAIDSVLAQSEGDFELLVVDDGSTDGSADAAEVGDPRVHCLRQPPLGAGAARNLGARTARGRYLVFLDSDDEALPGWLAGLGALLDAGAAIAFCGIRYVDADGRTSDRPPVYRGPLLGGWVASFKAGTFALRRELFNAVCGYHAELPANQHTELAFRLVDHCQANGLEPAATSDVLAVAHRDAPGRIRHDPAAILEATEHLLDHHRDRLLRYRGDYANFLAVAGTAAYRLGDRRRARHHFARAVGLQPWRWKPWLRWLRSFVPGGGADDADAADG